MGDCTIFEFADRHNVHSGFIRNDHIEAYIKYRETGKVH